VFSSHPSPIGNHPRINKTNRAGPNDLPGFVCIDRERVSLIVATISLPLNIGRMYVAGGSDKIRMLSKDQRLSLEN
jgi:hypothetical protein